MKKIVPATLVLVCVAAFVPAAFALDAEDDQPWFQPTLRFGVAFDPEPAQYDFSRSTTFLGYSDVDLELESVARPYLALELPFSVTDRLKVSVNADWSFTSSDELGASDQYTNTTGVTVVRRTWNTDDTAHWVSAELLGSYAFIKDVSFLKDVSVVAGLRWEYVFMKFNNPRGIVTSNLDQLHFRMHSLAPVLGLSGTFNGFKQGIWGGDMHLSALAGPIAWGDEDYRERINNVNTLIYRGEQSPGYMVKLFGDVTILSGRITQTMGGSVALFTQFTKTRVNGSVDCKDLSQPFVDPRTFHFGGGGTVGVFGLSGAISF